ncbi:MAG: metallophosphoesterase [Clostridia bacterium]|nr:metallophosphoesterase [Clostridia bacterium]
MNNKVRIIQISDLHNCLYGKNNIKLLDRARKLKPDLIVYTGDIVDSKAKSNDRVISLCKELADVAPSYYIYGNNEVEMYYDIPLTQESLDKKFGFNDNNRQPGKLLEITDDLTRKLEATGVKVLKNKSDTITIGTTDVDIYGVLTSNPSSFWSYAGESFDEYMYSNENNLKITAIHEPLVFEEYSPDSWGDLMLAGHNHGGTVKIPMIGPLYTHDGGFLPDRGGHYVSGRYEVQGRPLIISSGLENKNIMRINNQPEIVIVDINKF